MSRLPPDTRDGELLLPLFVRITPSNINAWRGARRDDSRYTLAQLAVLPLYKLDPETCDDVIVRSTVSQAEYWWPMGQRPPVYLCPCPIVGRREDGRLLVISPAGMKKLVYSDGSITQRRAA